MQKASRLIMLFLPVMLYLVPGKTLAQGPGSRKEQNKQQNEQQKGINKDPVFSREDFKKAYLNMQSAFLLGFFDTGYGGNYTLGGAALHLSGGYAFQSWLQLGIGAGWEQYQKVIVVPVFAELRGNLSNKSVSPYYALKTGWGFAGYQDDFMYQTARGGWMGEGQAGLAFRYENMQFLLGGGYHWQKVELEGNSDGGWGPGSTLQTRQYRRLLGAVSLQLAF